MNCSKCDPANETNHLEGFGAIIAKWFKVEVTVVRMEPTPDPKTHHDHTVTRYRVPKYDFTLRGEGEDIDHAVGDMWRPDSSDYTPEDIGAARKVMRDSFDLDSDFERSYIDNISCILMDHPFISTDKVSRDRVAKLILDKMIRS